jgi:DNA invertase Pin-like site-specific DNA recombinase
MSQTVAYVRVSTDDQVEFSPEAQAKRCKDLARLRDLGPLQVMADEGWSGKNLERPKMRELLERVEAGEIAHLVVWRWDRLSRDQEDFAALVKLFDRCGVQVHSVNEGDLDLRTASGRMQIGVHGVFAQFYRDQIVENSRMGMRQAFEMGRWQNRAPTGFDMVNGRLEPNEMAPIVQRIFALRSAGASYPAIAAETGICYSTARHILENRVYLGEVSLSNEWGPGIHQALVTLDEFNASQRGHTKGQRRSADLLSGVVRCGAVPTGGLCPLQRAQPGALRVPAPGRGLQAARASRQWPPEGRGARTATARDRSGPPGRDPRGAQRTQAGRSAQGAIGGVLDAGEPDGEAPQAPGPVLRGPDRWGDLRSRERAADGPDQHAAGGDRACRG